MENKKNKKVQGTMITKFQVRKWGNWKINLGANWIGGWILPMRALGIFIFQMETSFQGTECNDKEG